ncbi:MAG: hypothetical protein ABI877_22735 [Gemmatimonadaceae bacterium]
MHQHTLVSRMSWRRLVFRLVVVPTIAASIGCNENPVTYPDLPRAPKDDPATLTSPTVANKLADHVEAVARDPRQSRTWRATIKSSTGRVDTVTAREYAARLRSSVRHAEAWSISTGGRGKQ